MLIDLTSLVFMNFVSYSYRKMTGEKCFWMSCNTRSQADLKRILLRSIEEALKIHSKAQDLGEEYESRKKRIFADLWPIVQLLPTSHNVEFYLNYMLRNKDSCPDIQQRLDDCIYAYDYEFEYSKHEPQFPPPFPEDPLLKLVRERLIVALD